MPRTAAHSNGALVIAIDLGTSATTAQFALALDSFDSEGRLHRKKNGRVTDMRAWPGGRRNDAIGNTCLPTDLVYDKATGQLLFWGFHAQRYLDDPSPNIPREDVFVVEHIKLMLNDPNDEKNTTTASIRYRTMRQNLTDNLKKSPYEVFEDFLNEVIQHIIKEAKRLANFPLNNFKLELSLAFPSGWPEYVHRKVAEIGARAVRRALVANDLTNMMFGIENVYTVSETLCGVKEWLSASIEDASMSVDLGPQTLNLDELQEGDCFVPFDIGGGTGCLTILKLVSKHPLQVDQLAATQSLEVSGEAVEAEFERRLRSMISVRDYKGDLERLIYQVCREFKEEKKNCGQPPRPGSRTWNIPAPRLRANPRKGFEKDCLKIDLKLLDESFDPVISIVEFAIMKVKEKNPEIKAVVFLGQFGGSSDYLRNRMARSPITRSLKLHHSQSGKFDVVKGAMSERLSLRDKFVRKSETMKSYGALVSLPYYKGSEGHKLFPNAVRDGAEPFEKGERKMWLTIVEWVIPKGTILEGDLEFVDIGEYGKRYHTWAFNEPEIEFEDVIIVSDETPPPPHTDGKSYTLWTKAHENNELFVNNRKLDVLQIPFSWELGMSQKLDLNGNVVGSYDRDELEAYMWPPEKKKGIKREKLRRLEYDLLWNITEMQVKTYVRPLFPKPAGPLTMQLAKERPLPDHELRHGESRSHALVRDIEITRAALPTSDTEGIAEPVESVVSNREPVEQSREPRAPVVATIESHPKPQSSAPVAQMFSQGRQPLAELRAEAITVAGSSASTLPRPDSSISYAAASVPTKNVTQPSSSSSNEKADGRRREGCYTCKDRKKKCDCTYTIDGTTGSRSCNTCSRYGIACHMTQPEWSNDPEQLKAQQDERKRLVKLRRKSREESDSSGRYSRDRSATTGAARLNQSV